MSMLRKAHFAFMATRWATGSIVLGLAFALKEFGKPIRRAVAMMMLLGWLYICAHVAVAWARGGFNFSPQAMRHSEVQR